MAFCRTRGSRHALAEFFLYSILIADLIISTSVQRLQIMQTIWTTVHPNNAKFSCVENVIQYFNQHAVIPRCIRVHISTCIFIVTHTLHVMLQYL